MLRELCDLHGLLFGARPQVGVRRILDRALGRDGYWVGEAMQVWHRAHYPARRNGPTLDELQETMRVSVKSRASQRRQRELLAIVDDATQSDTIRDVARILARLCALSLPDPPPGAGDSLTPTPNGAPCPGSAPDRGSQDGTR